MSSGVLYIIFSLSNGGTQRNIVNAINNIHIADQRKVLFLYNATISSDLEKQLDKSVKIYRIADSSIFKNIVRFSALIKVIRKEKITSVVSFALNGSYLVIFSRFFFPFRKLPIIYRLVSVDSALTISNIRVISKMKKFLFINVVCRFVDTIICQSDFMKNSLVSKSTTLLKNKVLVIKNLVDFSSIDESIDDCLNINYQYFVYVGRLSPEKNVVEIVKAFNLIKDKTNCKLLIIGDGKELELINDAITTFNLADRIHLIGFKTNPYKYMKRAVGLILYSSYEGFPNVVLEAMYCKTPVIISNFEGAEELVNHKENGFIVEQNDVNDLSNSMLELIKNRDLRERMAEKSHEIVLKLNTESISKYESLLNGK